MGSRCLHVRVVGLGAHHSELAWPSPRFPGVGGAPLSFESWAGDAAGPRRAC